MKINAALIAETYKIIGQIGSGGGGIVYLAEHVRLDKKVVLKADKRKLSTKPEALRREVDSLKNLSHTYIPQVYDFIEENGIVYTVMDYIDGESFDRPLKRGERFTQAQVVEWACELLEALVYLHGRPPHGVLHADIKPANIMLTPQKDIRLIDFNIALALGEEGAVAVGRSFGYASPEHYGLDYSAANATQGASIDVATELPDAVTELSDVQLADVVTELESKIQSQASSAGSGSGVSGKKSVILDVRSDIYSLGATLYHIMTGERPAQNALDVKSISVQDFSPAVIGIINKAMNPNPDLRYQSAAQMLYAFEHLRENDPRVKQFKGTIMATVAIVLIGFLTGGLSVFTGLKQMEQLQSAYVLAEYSGNALRRGEVSSAIHYALQALPEEQGLFALPRTAEAQKALTDALNVYDLSDGFKAHGTIELPAAPLYMEISPDGKTALCVYASAVAVFDTDTALITATLPAVASALVEAHFIDNDTIIYAGKSGISAYNLAKGKLWTGKPATAIAISQDGRYAAAVYKDDDFATVYDAADGRVMREVSFEGRSQRITVNDVFANPNDNLFALNQDGTKLGVSFSDGSLMIYNMRDQDGDLELFDDTSGYTHFEGGFSGLYFAFSAANTSGSVFAVIDTVRKEQTGGFESESYFGVQTDESGIFVQTDNLLVKLHPVTGEQTAMVTTSEPIARFARGGGYTLMTSETEYMFFDQNAALISRHEKETSGDHDKKSSGDFVQMAGETALIGSLDAPVVRIAKLKNHPEAEIFAYDSSYTHDEARISEDGKTVMLFSYDRFRLQSIEGAIIAEAAVPNADQVYDQQYHKEENGSYLEVIYNDGAIKHYSAADGSLFRESVGEKPNVTLDEEFFTDALRIESPLHGTPVAYDRETGELIRELEKDAYLTYVTQSGGYILTEYVTAEGFRYGLLLNSQCETLAYLPYLCDIDGEELIFDYPNGHLRKSRIYQIEELIELARD